MHPFAKRLLYRTVRRFGLSRAVHWARFRQHATIVMYHGVVRAPLEVRDRSFVDERSFAQQVQFLKRAFDVIPLREVVDRLRAGHVRRPTAAITFDDGFQNNYDVAWPILRNASMPATIFLVTGLIDSSDMVWSCRLHRAITETPRSEVHWDQSRFDLRSPAARAGASSALKRRLKTLRPSALRTELAEIVRALGDAPDRPVDERSPYRMLNRKAIAEMSRSGLIDFGGHTCSHAILSLLSDDECRREVADSVAAVAELTGRPCTQFAYPNGRLGDYSPQAIQVLAASGVRTAVTTVSRVNDAETPALELGRYGIASDLSMRDFQATVHHVRPQLLRSA